MDDALPGAAGATQQVLRFALGGESHAIGLGSVREILEVGRLTELPLMPPFVRGVMNVRGAVVPVIDLAARVGFGPTAPAKRNCIVVVELDGEGGDAQRVGMLVDAVHEVDEIGAAELEAVPPLGTRVAPELLAGIARVRGQAVALLDARRVFAADTLASLISTQASH